ncbi:hypothetical protein [Sphingobium nicotianae]|uniref:Uncharacterized protein n=1 Tax=Sphingobium nicotianae TaxID=2782607 RepID=A0A9X1DCY0_9SPHN|nr:hypothetical protein [Sphingobium nicotianae]MBT2187626.1 hypothetical protein [Sphingobium nicotianae]
MQATAIRAAQASLSDADYLDLAHDALARKAPDALAPILAEADTRPDLWDSEPGQVLLVEAVALLLDAITEGEAALAIGTAGAVPPKLAAKAHSLLLLAFFPEGHVGDLAALDDSALLGLALLTHRMGHRTRANELLDEALLRRLTAELAITARAIGDFFASAAKDHFKAKLIIWGLDGAPWRLDAGIVHALNERGIVSAICAEGDFETVKARLEAAGLWDELVFPHIGAEPKGKVVAQTIEDMLLEAGNVLFIDSDEGGLAQAAAAAPGLHVALAGSPACDAMLLRLLDQPPIAGNRIADYRILEARVADRRSLSDADFLLQSDICATYTTRMDNLSFVERIEELINRADPLNYTKTRIVPGTLREQVMNVTDYDVFCAFIWDKYGHHGLEGLVGTVVYHRWTRRPVHLAFSCRIMHMGVEDFLIRALQERYGEIDLSLLARPLPAQSSAAIRYVPFEEVREQILSAQAPRDWSKIRLRVMSDCMSGGFHHYSRFKDEIDFDNIPRVFKMSSMVTGNYEERSFPEFLVYNAAIDYMDWRWDDVATRIEPAVYTRALEAMCAFIVASDRKLLLFLPPEHAPDHFHNVLPHLTGAELKARDRAFNALWRAAAARHPAHIETIDLSGIVTETEMLGHAYHYAPSVLMRLTGMMDDWFAALK